MQEEGSENSSATTKGNPQQAEYSLSDEQLKLLIAGFEQISEEVRYRDRLMHTSYYLVVIAMVIGVGSLLSLFTADSLRYPPELVWGGILLLFGFASSGIGIVMLVYNEKRNNASRFRADIARKLEPYFDSSDIASPFDINRQVVGGEARYTENLNQIDFRIYQLESIIKTKLKASYIAVGFLFVGAFIIMCGLFSVALGMIWS
jgi:hypothetical protein